MHLAGAIIANALARAIGSRPGHTGTLASRDMLGTEKVDRHGASPSDVQRWRELLRRWKGSSREGEEVDIEGSLPMVEDAFATISRSRV